MIRRPSVGQFAERSCAGRGHLIGAIGALATGIIADPFE
jgi:hypothetical protein